MPFGKFACAGKGRDDPPQKPKARIFAHKKTPSGCPEGIFIIPAIDYQLTAISMTPGPTPLSRTIPVPRDVETIDPLLYSYSLAARMI